jgi:hypothetical protein
LTLSDGVIVIITIIIITIMVLEVKVPHRTTANARSLPYLLSWSASSPRTRVAALVRFGKVRSRSQ